MCSQLSGLGNWVRWVGELPQSMRVARGDRLRKSKVILWSVERPSKGAYRDVLIWLAILNLRVLKSYLERIAIN